MGSFGCRPVPRRSCGSIKQARLPVRELRQPQHCRDLFWACNGHKLCPAHAALASCRGDDAAGARERSRRLIGSLAGSLGVYFLLFATLLVALLLTGSRGGISATLIGIGLILLQFLRTRRLEVSSQCGILFGGACGTVQRVRDL